MFDEEDQPSKKTSLLPRPVLDAWSLDDLRGYIEALRGEIARAEGVIESKSAARGAADSVFRLG